MSLTIGIDPGATGAIATLDSYGCLVQVDDMPVVDKMVSAPLLVDLLKDHIDGEYEPGLVVIERVHSMPKQGVASSFKFGHAFGVVLGVVGGLGWRSVLVTPQAWKKPLGIGADKEKARRLAIETWPRHSDRFARKKDEGRAEAALLAAHGLALEEGVTA